MRVLLRKITGVEARIRIGDKYLNQDGRLKLMARFRTLLDGSISAVEQFRLCRDQFFGYRELVDTKEFDFTGHNSKRVANSTPHSLRLRASA